MTATNKDYGKISVGEISTLDITMLSQDLERSKHNLSTMQKTIKKIEMAIILKYSDQEKLEREKLSRPTGSVRIKDGRYCITINIPKKITWQQQDLEKGLEQVKKTGIDIEKIVKTTRRVPEAVYWDLSPNNRESLDQARIISKSNPIITISKNEDY